MKKNDVLLIVGGLGVLYLLSKSGSTFGSPTMVTYGSAGSAPGNLISGIGSFFSNLFGGPSQSSPTGIPVNTTSNPGINVVSNPGAYSSTPPDYGTYTTDSGNPCDPSSVNYNEQVCTELNG